MKALLKKNFHKAKFEGKNVNLLSFEEIYNRKLEGFGTFKGKVQIRKGSLDIESSINFSKIKNLDFSIKEAKTVLKYKKGVLSFTDLWLKLHRTSYRGNLILDFKNKKSSFDFFSPNARLSEFSQIQFKEESQTFFRVLKNLQGEGNVKIVGSSNFDLTGLDFNMKAELFRGSFFKEYFDHIKLNIISQKKSLKIQDSFVQKDGAKIFIQGDYSQNKLNIKASAKNFYLEPLFLKNLLPYFKGFYSI